MIRKVPGFIINPGSLRKGISLDGFNPIFNGTTLRQLWPKCFCNGPGTRAAFLNRGPWHTVCGLSMKAAFPIFYFDTLRLFCFKALYMRFKQLINGYAVYGSVRSTVV